MFFFAICFHPVGELFFVLDELDLHIHFASGILNLAQEKKIFNKGKHTRGRVLLRNRQWLWIGHRIRRREARPARPSTAAIAVVIAHVGTVTVIHGSREYSLVLLTITAHRATSSSSRRTPSAAPSMFPSSWGGMSGSCIHIFSLVKI